jgi:hypothetical protein
MPRTKKTATPAPAVFTTRFRFEAIYPSDREYANMMKLVVHRLNSCKQWLNGKERHGDSVTIDNIIAKGVEAKTLLHILVLADVIQDDFDWANVREEITKLTKEARDALVAKELAKPVSVKDFAKWAKNNKKYIA